MALTVIAAGCAPVTSAVVGAALDQGGGTDVGVNAQVGAENRQQVTGLSFGASSEQRLIRPQARTIEQSTAATGVRSEQVETVVVEAAENWLWILMTGVLGGWFIGWITETPRDMLRRAMRRD